MSLDELDRRIAALLHEDGRMSFTSIAKAVGVSEATARKRVTRLLDDGIVQIVGLIEPDITGHEVTAIVGLHIEGEDVDHIARQLEQWPEIRYASVCAGTYDLILEVAVPSNEALFEFLTKRLRAIPGVSGSDTSLVMKVIKDRHHWRGVSPSRSDLVDTPTHNQGK